MWSRIKKFKREIIVVVLSIPQLAELSKQICKFFYEPDIDKGEVLFSFVLSLLLLRGILSYRWPSIASHWWLCAHFLNIAAASLIVTTIFLFYAPVLSLMSVTFPAFLLLWTAISLYAWIDRMKSESSNVEPVADLNPENAE